MNDNFPYLDKESFFQFPPVETSTPEGIVAAGGNLSPGMLLSAYSQGLFPWYSEGDPILWWSPDPRCVILPHEIHISKSMKKLLKKNRFIVSLDTCFREVISACKEIPRKNQDGTWITDEMYDAYLELHRLGYAHSLEVWRERSLAGGIYGVSLGRTFFGESMFSRISNASKLALIQLMEFLNRMKFDLFDCQVNSPHLKTLGAKQIGREEFIKRLNKSLKTKTLQGSWKDFQ